MSKVKNYWIKTHNAFQNLTHMGKCHYENEKKNLISKLFNSPSTSSTRAFGSLFCAGTRHLYLVISPPPQGRLGTVFPLGICVAFCYKHILSICMKYMDQFVNHNVNLYLIGQHSHYLDHFPCTLKEKKLQM